MAIEIAASGCTVPEQRPFPPPGLKSGVYVRLQVRDEGCGMTSEVRDRVFEPFFTTRDPGKGTGLGLSTAYGIVQQHGGWIDCESKLGVGTTFSVYLPAGHPPNEDAGVKSPTSPKTPAASAAIRVGSETILIIDDEEKIRRTLARMLDRCGYTVLLAVDGEDGVDTYRRRRQEIDLVILDLSMPKIPGEETLRRLRALDADARIVIFTGRSTDAEGLPIDGLIKKPVTLRELTLTVRSILDN